MPKVEVCLSPHLFPLFNPQMKTVVVIDILRATSTITSALANGARGIIPVETADECLAYQGSGYVLAAERKGKKVEGFDHGNSPLEYPVEVIKDKTLVLTTTNGTKAFRAAHDAEMVYAGSFLSITALSKILTAEKRDVVLFCAGWKGRVSLEDTLFAGGLIKLLTASDLFSYNGDSARIAYGFYTLFEDDLEAAVRQSSHFERLAGLDILEDVAYCFRQDEFDFVPCYNNGLITKRKSQ